MSESARPANDAASSQTAPGSPFPVPGQSGTEIRPDGWPRGSGYSHAVSAEGRTIFVSGQIGWNPVTERLVDGGMAAQTRQALANIAAVLAAAGAEPAHLVRLTWFITGREAYLRERRAIGAAYREVFGRHFPAMSVVVVATLLEPGAEVEIEATAVIPTS
jgi:enamine deaminase RidA (YjgF/YER057c/UK114 family)